MEISNLKERKKRLRITTAQLAYIADLPVSTVSKVMTGETTKPSYITIEKIEAALLKEEMNRRIFSYVKEIEKYMKENPNEDFDIDLFENEYRNRHDLNDLPIPFAVPKRDEDLFETMDNLAIRRDNRMTFDFLSQLEDSKLVELIDGRLVYNSAPSLSHQILVEGITDQIKSFIKANGGECMAFGSGVNVFLDEDEFTSVIPDITVICDKSKLTQSGINGAPDWVIEVVSPSTKKRDYGEKMCKYLRAEVREYWIVDPIKEIVTVYTLGEPTMVFLYKFTDEIPVMIYDGKLKINLV